MNHDQYSDAYIKGILDEVKTVAMVGASANNVRPSYFVLKYLLAKGYDVWPINPGIAGKEILGQTVYAALDDLSEVPDMVDIFRNAEAAGVIMIHQEFNLAEHLSVEQNVFLGREIRRGIFLDHKAFMTQDSNMIHAVSTLYATCTG